MMSMRRSPQPPARPSLRLLFALAAALVCLPVASVSAQQPDKAQRGQGKAGKPEAKGDHGKADQFGEPSRRGKHGERTEVNRSGKPDRAGKPGRGDEHGAAGKDKAAEHRAEAAERKAQAGAGDDEASGIDGGEGESDDDKLARVKDKARARRENRKARAAELRAKARDRVRKHLDKRPMSRAVTEELRRHARRMARLHRVQAVAADSDDVAAVDRVDALIAKEQRRHERWMEQSASHQ